MISLSVCIPTYRRPEDIQKCMRSLVSQSILPQEVLVIDDDKLQEEVIVKLKDMAEQKGIRFIYTRKNHAMERRGSSESRNKALEVATHEILLILDDDVILEKGFLRKIMKLWDMNTAKELLGIGGVILNNRKKQKSEKWYNTIFCLRGKEIWDVSDIAFQSWDDGVNEVTKGFYAHGGVCSYRKDLVKKLGGFEPFSGGRSALEDVEFCMKAKRRGYYFLIEPEAKAVHQKSKLGREGEYLTGWKERVNRKIILQRYCDQAWNNKVRFVWGNIGWILRQFLAGHILKGWGMLNGFFAKKI